MNTVEDAVILMAGSGSRLNSENRNGEGPIALKPLVDLLGRPLISYTFESLIACGIRRIHSVVGFEAERLSNAVREVGPAGVEVHFIHNPEWQKQNGLSLFAAARVVHSPFILTMADHIFDSAIVELLIRDAERDCLTIAIDRKIDTIFDPPDAMKVQTRGDRVTALGKELQTYDAIDTGLFFCPPDLAAVLRHLNDRGDYSLSDVVSEMAVIDRARVIDIGSNWWQDVDTPEMLKHARERLSMRNRTVTAHPK